MRPNTAFAIGLLALTVGAISVLFTYPIKASLFPFMVSIPMAVLLVVQVVRECWQKSSPPTNLFSKTIGSPRKFIIEAGSLVAFIVILGLMGFLVAIPLYAFIYLKVHHRSWVFAMIVSLVLDAAIYFLFVSWFKVSLYQGILGGWLFRIVRGW
jgi:hypothetical protein